MPAAEIEEALREAVTHHVLVADGADRYAFRHALLQEAVYGDLLPGERVRLHAAYARLLAGQGDDTAADLARHCLAAHDLPGALAASLRAAERATAVLAPAEALGHLEQALQLVDAVPGDQRPAGAEPLQLTLRAAAAAGAAGELHRAASLARAAVAGAARGGDPALEAAARADLAKRLYEVDADVEALAEIAKVRSLLEGTGPSPTRVWAVALEAQLTHHDSIDGTRGLVEPALAEARALGLPAAEADLLLTLAVRRVPSATSRWRRAGSPRPSGSRPRPPTRSSRCGPCSTWASTGWTAAISRGRAPRWSRGWRRRSAPARP